jgi:hypothetical protein
MFRWLWRQLQWAGLFSCDNDQKGHNTQFELWPSHCSWLSNMPTHQESRWRCSQTSFKGNTHTQTFAHKRHATPAPAHTTPAYPWETDKVSRPPCCAYTRSQGGMARGSAIFFNSVQKNKRRHRALFGKFMANIPPFFTTLTSFTSLNFEARFHHLLMAVL